MAPPPSHATVLLWLALCRPSELAMRDANAALGTVQEPGPASEFLAHLDTGNFVVPGHFRLSFSHHTKGTMTFILNKNGGCKKFVG